ncbi:MAG: pilin [Candidatus Gracilibacteria bacterium]|jgi:hypothetical protein|nr:pilin [Candidatus Gracilibacteria bacterium]MDD5178741.1 pilin [Candidatus Gracilibacteria bacterium]
MLKLSQKSRNDIQKLASDSKFALVFFFLALGVLIWILGFGEAKQLQSSVIFDAAAQSQLKPYVDAVKTARSDYRKAIGQGDSGAYDKQQEAANCTTRLAAQIDTAKELRGDYQQLDAAIGYEDYAQTQRSAAKTKSELTNSTIGEAFNANDKYWVNLKNEEVAVRNKLEATNAAVGDCLSLYSNDTTKCIQQKADWDKAQEDYAAVVLKIKNAVKERELETIQKVDSKSTNPKTSFLSQPALLKAGIFGDLFSSTTGAVAAGGSCGVVGSGATCQATSLFICPDGWQGYSGGGDCASGYKCCVKTITAATTATTTTSATTGILSTATSSLVGSAATSLLGGLLGNNGGTVNVGGTNWNLGFTWPSSNGSTAIITGPGAAQGLTVFKNNYKGNTYSNAIGMIAGWTNFVLPFVSVLAITALIYAGFLYITAFGNEEQTGKAKKIILWVVVGIVLIISAYAIVNTLVSEGSNGNSDGGNVNVSTGDSGVNVNW